MVVDFDVVADDVFDVFGSDKQFTKPFVRLTLSYADGRCWLIMTNKITIINNGDFNVKSGLALKSMAAMQLSLKTFFIDRIIEFSQSPDAYLLILF